MSGLTGKLKEVTGKVIGNEDLAHEGVLEQAEADARRDAEVKDAIAQAEASEAAEQLAREQAAADAALRGAEASADVREEQILREAHIDLVKAEAEADQQRIAQQHRIDADTRAELQQNAAHVVQAQLKYADEQAKAAAAEKAADRARKEIS